MKKILFTITLLLMICMQVSAQPKARKNQQKTTTTGVTERQRLTFPTAVAMPEDVVWRRDIYRTLDLTKDANAALYYPVEPMGKQINMFTFVFRLVITGALPIYQYRLDGNESFMEKDKIKVKEFLDNYNIFYEEKDGRFVIDNSDVPSAEVLSYYIKECSYYDQNTSTFATKVLALCPIMHRREGYASGATKFPLFWIKYSDLEPFLSRLTMMTSNYNNAATMSAADYFTLKKYKGDIYKTNNMLGKSLSQYCPNDTAMKKEQARIEAELLAFEKNIYGSTVKKDSLDSVPATKNGKEKAKKSSTRRSGSKGSTVKKSAPKKTKSSSSSTGRISVRRERH